MTDSITIHLRLPSKACHPNARPHYMAKANATRKDRMLACYVAIEAMKARTFGWRSATEQVVFRVKGHHDHANLSQWLKAYRDGIVDAGVLTNDDRIVHLPIEQIVNRKAETGVTITLTKRCDP